MPARSLLRRVALGLAGTAAAVAFAVAPSAHAIAGEASPRCRTSDLEGHFGRVDAGAGQRSATLILRNVSEVTCQVKGYVGAQLIRPSGAKVPTTIVRDHSATPHQVILDPGAKAGSVVRWGAIASGSESTSGPCEPTASTLRVTPPDETTQLSVKWKGGPVCGNGRISVKPLVHHE